MYATAIRVFPFSFCGASINNFELEPLTIESRYFYMIKEKILQ